MKRKVLIGIIIFLNIVLCASILLFVRLVTNSGIRLDRKLNLGNKYLLSMDYEKALRAFTDAIDIDPMADAAYTGRGDTYLAMGDYENAWNDYEKAQEITGDDSLCESRFGRTRLLVTDSSGAPLPGASVSVANENHSYQMQTDADGIASEVICPADYHMNVAKDDYVDMEEDVQIEYEQHTIDTVVLEADDPNIAVTEALNAYAEQLSYMYGNNYQISAHLNGYELVRDNGNLPADAYMGYTIRDFDGDGVSELCAAKLNGNYGVQLIMYETASGQVTEQSRLDLDVDMNAAWASSSHMGGWNNELSLFTSVQDGKICIFADYYKLEGVFADGVGRGVQRVEYDGASLYEHGAAGYGGSDLDPADLREFEGYMRDMGAVNPDAESLVAHSGGFAYSYFDNAEEFVHDEFYTESLSGDIQSGNRGASGSWRCAPRDAMYRR